MRLKKHLIMFLLIAVSGLMPRGDLLRASNDVTFQFNLSGVAKVRVYGSFNGWSKGVSLEEKQPGKWQQTVELGYGRYEYKFLVDGKWKYDTSLPSIDDGLYSRNNVMIVR